jgi:iron complex outermembrane recepter protein
MGRNHLNTTKNSALRNSAAPFALALALIAAPAFAQDAPQAAAAQAPEAVADETEIVVTGSRIARPDLAATSPVSIVGAEQIKSVNTVTVEQILAVNPQFAPGSTGASNNPGEGSATLDLRYFGPQRTLVLLNGKRLPVYDSQGQVDVNQIPTALIKNIQILTGGASAVYGSDAIAGVVNFVLDDKFTGLKLDAGAQITGQGDGGIYDFSLTGGIKLGDRGHLVVTGNYAERQGVRFGARPFSNTVLCSDDLVSFCGSSNTTPTAFDIPGAGRQQITSAGGLTEDVVGYNYAPINYAQVPLKRYGGLALFNYDLSDNVTAYGQGYYQHVAVVTTLAPTATAGFFFNIDPSNPFLTAAQRNAFFDAGANPDLCINDATPDTCSGDPTARLGTSTVGIRRRITETGGRVQEFTSDTYQALLGLRGTIGSNLHWDVSAQYAEVKKNNILRNDLSYTALQQALDVVAGPNGPQCFNPAGGCVPLNLFVTGDLSPQSLAFVLRNATQNNKTTQFVAEGSIGGDIGFLTSPLASKPAAFSFGAAYRKETASTAVDPLYASGDLIYYGQGFNIAGRYDVKEVYGEFIMPLIQDKPFAESLNFEGGYRYSNYSTAGGVHSYKFGGDWTPVRGLKFRAIYQRAVRAPNIFELYVPLTSGTGALGTDPCAGANVPAATAAICIAQGAPAGSIGTIPEPIAGQVNGFTGGNSRLGAEKADTYTFGAVIQPAQIPGLSLAVDYYSIKLGNAITFPPTQFVVNQCFVVEKNAAGANCQSIVRNRLDGSLSGPISVGVPTLYSNFARIGARGVDVDLSYSRGASDRFHYSFSFAGTYQISNTTQLSECAGRFGASCDTPLPKWKHTANLGLGFGSVDFNTRWRLIGATRQDSDTDILKSSIPAYSYFDETVNLRVNDKFTLSLGVLNLLDTKPPIVGDTSGALSTAGSTFPTVYDVLGRSVFARVTAAF